MEWDNISETNNAKFFNNDSDYEKIKSDLTESRVLILYTGGTIGMRWKPNEHGATLGGNVLF